MRPPEYPLRSAVLHNLAFSLETYWNIFFDLSTLEELIVVQRELVSLPSSVGDDIVRLLMDLTVLLQAKYERLKVDSNLDEMLRTSPRPLL